MTSRNYCLIILILLLAAGPAAAITRDEAVTVISARYRITTTGTFGGFVAIGSIVTPQQAGLRANRPSKAFSPNLIRDHRLVAAGGGTLPPGGGHDGLLKLGEQLHLYDIVTGDDYVQLDLFTVATYVLTGSGKQGPIPLQASVRFQYEGGLAGVTAFQLLNDIGEWVATTGEPQQTPQAISAPRDSAPNIHDTGANVRITTTIRLGQTKEEVLAIFGPPEQQILLGAKEVFVYRNVKVIFRDGKVVDAE